MAGTQHNSKFALSRYFAVGVVMCHFVLAVLAINVAAVLFTGPAPSWLIPKQEWLPYNIRDELGGRLAGIIEARRAAGTAENPHVVILGFSTVREGFSPTFFEPANRGIPRFWNLGTSGGGFQQLHEQVELFCASGLETDVVLLGIHPSYLVGRRTTYSSDPTDLGDIWEAIRGRNPRNFKHALGHLFWPCRDRELIHRWIDRLLTQGRMSLLKKAGFQTLFQPASDPFAVQQGYPMRRGQEDLNRQMKGWEALGWFDQDVYEENEDQQSYLVDAVCQLQARSKLVGVVMMPETSELRRRVPPIASQTVRTVLDKHFSDAPVVQIDLRDEFDDGMFADYAHLNARGREAFSARLEHELENVIKQADHGSVASKSES